MADGHLGPRAATSWPITKIFTAFRIALDLKKLALAAAGIFVTFLGWWALCWVFYTPDKPEWSKYQGQDDSENASWTRFKRDRARWNLLHHLAGPPTNDPKQAVAVDIGDIATSPEEFKELNAVREGRELVTLDLSKEPQLQLVGLTVKINATEADIAALKAGGSVPLVNVAVGDAKEQTVTILGRSIKVETDFEKLRHRREGVKPLTALAPILQERFVSVLETIAYKPAGKFRVSPWSEDRGENPYLLTMRVLQGENLPFIRGGFIHWALHDQLPVLAEPIIKFVSPVFYIFQSNAGGFRNFFLLLFIILWNLAVWGYFGGAICRLAAVQFARNEKIPLSEAIGFVNERCKHFFLAPVFPLVCVTLLALALAAFGFVTGWTHLFGDIVLAGLFWPIVILLGLIMAVVLLGLFAWPLMYPTIAVEGSDSFDALSRSYSYLYQAPWQFLGYVAAALVYGAVVVFFVGFMGSLTVYLGKWGFNQAPWLAAPLDSPEKDRTPVYFFANAPTSFGWRDLFLHDSQWAEKVEVAPLALALAPGQAELQPKDLSVIRWYGGKNYLAPSQWRLQQKYVDHFSWNNRTGGWLVTFWLGLMFLLVVGFAYSYFWTAGTILYFLMRKKVDDVDFDEIHLDEDNIPPPPPPPMKEPPAAPKPGTVSLDVVEPPPAPPRPPEPPVAPPTS